MVEKEYDKEGKQDVIQRLTYTSFEFVVNSLTYGKRVGSSKYVGNSVGKSVGIRVGNGVVLLCL